MVPTYVPAASSEALAVTVSVAGALVPELVTVSQGASDVAVNGTVFPVPSAVTWIDCDAGAWLLVAGPLNVMAVCERCSTGLFVTTNVTGNVVTFGCPATAMVTVVV